MTIGATDITVAIPSIPPRRPLLARALRSVLEQTLPTAAVSVAVDHAKRGAAETRQRTLDAVQTPWVAFLDDDDEFEPYHLERLAAHAEETGADYVFSWYRLVLASGRLIENDPIFPPGHYLNPWDPANPRQTTITVLVRTELAREAGGFVTVPEGAVLPDGNRAGEDYRWTLECNRLGKISHLVEKTWRWHHDSNNTSGLPDRW